MRRVVWITHQHVHLYRAIILSTNRTHLGKELTEHLILCTHTQAVCRSLGSYVANGVALQSLPFYQRNADSLLSAATATATKPQAARTWQKGNDKRWLQIYADAPTAHHFHRKRMTAIVLLARGLT